jgi:nitroreductase
MSFQADQWIHDLNWRYATKVFDPSKKISDHDWKVLEETLRLSPSSYGLQPWKFIVVQNPEMREKLRKVSWNQSQVTDCSHFVVITALKKVTPEYISSFIQHTAQVRNLDPATLAGYEKMMNGDLVTGPRAAAIRPWAERQCYLAFGNIMNAAAAMHIDTCPLEGLDPAAYDELLNLKDSNYATIAAVAVGYRHADDKYAQLKKVRFESNQVISWIK